MNSPQRPVLRWSKEWLFLQVILSPVLPSHGWFGQGWGRWSVGGMQDGCRMLWPLGYSVVCWAAWAGDGDPWVEV